MKKILLSLSVLLSAGLLFAAEEKVDITTSSLYKYKQQQERLSARLPKERTKKGKANTQRLIKQNQEHFKEAYQAELVRLDKDRKFVESRMKTAKEEDKPRLEKMTRELNQREKAFKAIAAALKPAPPAKK